MTDDVTNPADPEVTALEQDNAEAPEFLEQDETDLDGEGADDEDQAPEDDFDEIEKDGQKYKIPKALKGDFLMQADYTRKTQELAEQRKAVEATLQQVQAVSQEEQAAIVALGVIDTQLADYKDIDWDTWEQTDPVSAQRAWRQFQTLKDQRQTAIGAYTQAQQQRAFVTQQETAKLLEQGARELAVKIPGWGQEKANALRDHAITSYGFSPADLSNLVDPRMIQVLNDAFEYRQQQQQQRTVKKVQAQQEVKPAATIKSGKAAVPKGLDDRLSAEEWMKRRNAQLASRN